MELPAKLRHIADEILSHTAMADLSTASQRLTARYRNEIRDGKMHLDSTTAAKAYIAARLPATYAAIYQSLDALYEIMPDFAPRSLLDAGSGPGTALYAANEVFSQLDCANLYEQSNDIARIGQALSQQVIDFDVRWHQGNLTSASTLDAMPKSDLVTLGYVLDELGEAEQDRLVSALWQKTGEALVLVEPGTPAGWQRLMRQRNRLIQQGGYIAAPCPHMNQCGLESLPPEHIAKSVKQLSNRDMRKNKRSEHGCGSTFCGRALENSPPNRPKVQSTSRHAGNSDWCHFSVRVARSRIHRLTKQADVPWEDEKFAYIAITRTKPDNYAARVLAPPHKSSGKTWIKLCDQKGNVTETLFTRRDGTTYKTASRLNWGDCFTN